MAVSAKQAFAKRLVEAMIDAKLHSPRNAKSKVNVGPLAKAAGTTREMARRYVEGKALPDPNKLPSIARFLEVKLPWLRDGEGPKRAGEQVAGGQAQAAHDIAAEPYMSEEAREIAQIWSNLPDERRQWFRDLMVLEAVVSKHYPWLMFGRPKAESYREYEKRVEHDFIRATKRLMMREQQDPPKS